MTNSEIKALLKDYFRCDELNDNDITPEKKLEICGIYLDAKDKLKKYLEELWPEELEVHYKSRYITADVAVKKKFFDFEYLVQDYLEYAGTGRYSVQAFVNSVVKDSQNNIKKYFKEDFA